jgi:MFS transporter, FHS family, glucose/mannose:H+ symporter
MPAATIQAPGVAPRPRPSLLDLNAGFALAGMATTLLGPVVPGLAERWHLADATVATLFTTQWICSTSFTLLSSVLVVRFDAARVIVAGYALAAAGVLALGVAPWPWTLVATALYGCGLGLVLPTTNLLVARMNPGREASAVSFVNVSWSVGAVAWPVVVGLLARPAAMWRPLALLASLLGLIVVRLLPGRTAPDAAGGPHRTTAPAADVPVAAPSSSQLAIFAVLLMLYSGTEASIGGWVAEHVRRLGASHWAMSATLFWLAITAGRLSTPFLLGRAGERRLLVAGLLIAMVGAAGLAVAPTPAIALVAVTTAGLGLSPVFPVTFAALTRDVGPTRPRLVGPLFACTGIGSALLPWMVGASSTLTGSLGVGLFVPALGSLGLLVLSLGRPSHE